MIYIQKQRTPDIAKQKAAEIMNAPENDFSNITLPEDTKRLRGLFEQMPKIEIAAALCKEQHGLCAYCMSRIVSSEHGSMKIEHYKALSRNKEQALDYQNFLGVCLGGEKDNKDKPHILCCDAARGDKELVINPRDKRHMEAIGYKRNGEIFVRSDKGLDPQLVDAMQKDIDSVLTLNGKKNAEGLVLYDTASKLIAKRRGIYQSVSKQFDRWNKKKCLTAGFLSDKINYLEKQLKKDAVAEDFIGIRLYFYKRKYRKLKRLE